MMILKKYKGERLGNMRNQNLTHALFIIELPFPLPPLDEPSLFYDSVSDLRLKCEPRKRGGGNKLYKCL